MNVLRLLTFITLFVATSALPTGATAGDLMSIVEHYKSQGGGGNFWVNAEYLNWKTTGAKLPALVTGNPLNTPAVEAGVIGVDSTEILFGNSKILDDSRSGYRLGGGTWLTCNLGLEFDYFRLSDENYSSQFDEGSGLIIGRPFINLSPLPAGSDPRWDSQLIVFPNVANGYVRVSGSSEFYGYGTRLIYNLCRDCDSGTVCNTGACDSGCDGGCDQSCCKPRRLRSRCFNVSLGHRHLSLNEHVRIDEELFTAADQFDVTDQFRTESSFDGLEIGFDWKGQCGHFCFDAYSRFAVGVNDNDIHISGETTDDTTGTFVTREGGILAQASNIGDYDCNVASLVAQLGFNGRVQLTKCFSANAGYSVLYWGNVARAGEQIDLNVNPGLFPIPVAPVGTIGTLPTHKLTDFVAHGLNLGITAVY